MDQKQTLDPQKQTVDEQKATSDPQKRLQQTSNKRNCNLTMIPKAFQELLSFMQSNIRKQFRSFSILGRCGGADKTKFIVDPHFVKAFHQLTTDQKLDLYTRAVDNGVDILKVKDSKINYDLALYQQMSKMKFTQKKQFPITIHEGFLSSHQVKVTLEGFKISSKNIFNIDLQNYLFRKSKKRSPQCFVLQAINESIPETIRFSFLRQNQQAQYLNKIKDLVNLAFKSKIRTMVTPRIRISQQQKPIQKKQSDNSYGKLRQTKLTQQRQMPLANLNIDSKSLLQFSHSLTSIKNLPRVQKQSNPLIQELLHQKQNIQVDQQKPQSSKYEQTSQNIFNKVLQSQSNIKQKLPSQKRLFPQQTKLSQEQLSQKQLQIPSINVVRYKNIFQQMLPEIALTQMDSQNAFTKGIFAQKNFRIFQHANQLQRFKLQFYLDQTFQFDHVYRLLIDCQELKKWNKEVRQSQIKITLTTQNCLLCYQKHARYSNWFKQRDYLFLRHAFTYRNAKYICDKSIQHTSFIPFHAIQRGFIEHSITRLKETHDKKIEITIDLSIKHNGYLGIQKRSQLTINYLKGYQNLQNYLLMNKGKTFETYCNLDWSIDWIQSSLANQSHFSIKTQQFDQGQQIGLDAINFQTDSEFKQQDFYSINEDDNQFEQTQRNIKSIPKIYHQQTTEKLQSEEKPQIQMSSVQDYQQPEQKNHIQLDQEGYCVLSQNYIQKKHILEPVNGKFSVIDRKFKNILLKDDFIQDSEAGMKLINKKKISSQNSVLAFVLKTMKKNLFSGKSILSISLPVEIFKDDSNTQRMCWSMALGPYFLQKAAASKDALQRMKWAISFAFSNQVLYFQIQKPFNPILGQTYQGMINGCPIYAQQISHHPPITSVYLIGRGYRVHASVQSKVYLHLNSGDGINDGYYSIVFDDGQVIRFQTAPGELSGFTIGDRKYRYKDRTYVFCQKQRLYAELLFQNPNAGFFSKEKWTADQLGGQILKVTPAFMKKVIQSTSKTQKAHPTKKDIEKSLSKIQGKWIYHLSFDGQKYYDVQQNLPYQMVNYQHALLSDARFRQDLIYRSKDDLAKSQIHKEYLENKQRKDRKLRQQYKGQTH